jgi:hypothetical protein
MNPPPEPIFIMGLIVGVIGLLLIQAFGRRKARQAVAAINQDAQRNITLLVNENERQTGQIDRLQDRIAVLERIAVEPAIRTARAIEELR